MSSHLDNKVNEELEKFKEKIEIGFDPVSALAAILPRILKEQDRDTRHLCAEAVLSTENNIQAHSACMNVNTFPETKKPKLK